MWLVDVCTVEQRVTEFSSNEVQFAIHKLKRYKSPGIDSISVELLQAGGRTLP